MFNWHKSYNINKNILDISHDQIEKIKSHKAYLLRNVNLNKTSDLINFAGKFGQILKYGKKSYVSFKEVSIENEMHYDGISAPQQKKIPKYLFFYVEKTNKINDNKKNKGEFKLLNSLQSISDIPKKTLKFLKNKRLEFYGCPTFYKPDIKIEELSFKKRIIDSANGKLNLRTHIISSASSKITIDNRYVETVEGWKVKISSCTGKQTFALFKLISKNIFNKKNLWKIKFRNKDLLIVDNRYVFHGRNSVSIPTKRLIHRVQVL